MMFDGLYQDQAEQALNAKAMRPPEPDPNARRFSMWGTLGAAPKGVAAGSAQALASTADLSKGTTENWLGGINSQLGRIPVFSAVQAMVKTGQDVLNPTEGKFTSDVGTSLRNVAQDYTPDAQTTHVAESVVFNLFRVGSKAVTAAATMGNIPGAVLAGSEEGFSQADELARQGVDINTRTKVGAVTGAVNTVGFALPAAGKTWLQTGALALAGGPASFIAQNAATREILQNADYSKLADQFDPFDPVGLTLSTVVPLGFGAMAMRGAKVKGGAAESGANKPLAPANIDASAMNKVAPPDDVVDAARVTLVRQQMDAANPVPERMDMADAHVAAYTRAMDQMAAGERVQVADIAPADGAKITEWVATVAKAADEAQAAAKADMPAQVADVPPAVAAAADAAKPTDAAPTFNPTALANEATNLLAGGKTADQVIGELEATGAKVPPELQNMVIGVAEFGGRVNDLVDQVKALQAQRGANAQGFDLIAQAVDNLRTGKVVETKAPANPLEKSLSDIAGRNPTALDAEIPIDFDANGKPGTRITVRDYIDMVKREADQDTADADLIEVAANCFLRGGL